MDEIKKVLEKHLPSEAISQHPTKPYLSSIKAIYVTERFNEAFGVGKWSVKVQAEHTDFNTGMIVVKVIFEVPELGIYYESFGGNDNGGVNNKNFDLGDAYKGASTDAITKIGSYLGVGINVFKNKIKSSSNDTKTGDKDDDKQWINIGDKGWEKAVKLKMPLNELRNYYKVSKRNAEQYLKEITKEL